MTNQQSIDLVGFDPEVDEFVLIKAMFTGRGWEGSVECDEWRSADLRCWRCHSI